MTARVQINRFSATGQRPSSSRPVGEIYANYADNQFGIIDYTPGVRDLLAIRYHSEAAAYTTGDYVIAGTGSATTIYKATAAISPGVFNSAGWDLLPTLSQNDARYLRFSSGGTITGPVTFTNTVTLSGDPTLPLQAATKQYVDTRVFRSGDTMTGYLTLHADPTVAMHAATAQYVNNQIANSNLFLRLTGGTLSGSISVGGAGILYQNLYAPDQHWVSFGWNGSLYGVVDNTYVGQIATRDFVSGAYLPLTGGTISGTLVVNGEMQTAAIYRINNTGAFFHSYVDETYIQWDGGQWSLRYQRSTGYLWYRRGGDGFNLFAVDGNGNVHAGGTLQTDTNVVANNNGYFRGGTVWFGGSDRSKLQSDNSTFTALFFVDNYRWQFNWADSSVHVYNWSSEDILALDGAGSLSVRSNLSAGLQVSAGTGVSAQAGQMFMGNSGGGRILQMSPSWYWSWDISTGTLIWNRPTVGYFWVMDATTSFCYNNVGPVGGVGGYVPLSDERSKTGIRPLDLGLKAVLQLNPVSFVRTLNGQYDAGFLAQEVQRVIPTAVREFGPSGDPDAPLLGVVLDPIVAAMVNGMKELTIRVADLEERA